MLVEESGEFKKPQVDNGETPTEYPDVSSTDKAEMKLPTLDEVRAAVREGEDIIAECLKERRRKTIIYNPKTNLRRMTI